MDKLIRLNHMTGDTVTPRHFNALVDAINAQARLIETLWKALDAVIAEAEVTSSSVKTIINVMLERGDDE
jgi:hypothetical protein